MGKIRVLLADDNREVMERVREILGQDFEIVGTADNGRDAVAAVARLNPDILVIDISMPILNGLQAANQISAKRQQTKIVFLTVHTNKDLVAAALSAGAYGYVAKADMATDLVAAIHDALSGLIFVSKSISLSPQFSDPGNLQ